jgi:exodeoxyribonuclease V beta subunit
VPKVGGDLSGLARLLFGAPSGGAADAKVALPDPRATVEHLRDRFRAQDAAAVVRVDEISSPIGSSGRVPQSVSADADAVLGVSTLGRNLARDARVWSFTSLSGIIRADPVTTGAADPAVECGDDRAAGDEVVESTPSPGVAGEPTVASVVVGADRVSPFDGLGAGKDFGNLVHDLFEHLDFAAADLDTAIADLLTSRGGSRVTDEQRARLPGALADVIRTPLGARLGHLRLADLEATDHLDELSFYLPVAPDRPVSASRIGALIGQHLVDGDLLAPWADRLVAGLAGVDLQGYLNGSIDLTLRYRVDGGWRYSVLDYKTNDLAPRGTPGLLSHYGPEAMARTMAHAHYALQAVIYSVALHRYLRWRLADYDPAVHLGPVGYLFVRAMVGAETPVVASGPHAGTPVGVFTWPLPPSLIEAVSALFAGDEGGDGA